jgi:ribosome maturation factor RimP
LFAVLDEEVMMSRTESIRELAEPIVAAAELDLWDVEVANGLVRVLVDRPAGVDLDALTQASRGLSALLDAHEDLLPSGRYDLEVSSPGIERTLRTPSQYQRYQGSEIAVKVAQAVAGSRRLQGTLLEATEQAIVLRPEGPSTPGQVDQRLTIDYSNIQRSHLVVSWSAVASAVPGRPKPNDRARSRAGAQRKSADAGVRVASGLAPEPKDA